MIRVASVSSVLVAFLALSTILANSAEAASVNETLAIKCSMAGGNSCQKLDRKCEHRDANACLLIGKIRIQQHDTEEGLRLLRLSCRYGDKRVCDALASFEEERERETNDAALAEQQRRQAYEAQVVEEQRQRAIAANFQRATMIYQMGMQNIGSVDYAGPLAAAAQAAAPPPPPPHLTCRTRARGDAYSAVYDTDCSP